MTPFQTIYDRAPARKGGAGVIIMPPTGKRDPAARRLAARFQRPPPAGASIISEPVVHPMLS